MRDSNQTEADRFERCHGGGSAYEAYKKIEHKFTDEFRVLTLELLVETYLRSQMDSPQLTDREFVNCKNIWRSIAEELGVLGTYPYTQDGFPHAHPMAKDASTIAKQRLGIL